MAKKVKFPLDMGNEVYVRTLEELKENYNSEKVTEYFLDGRLLTWLNDRYFDDEAEQVQELMEQEDKNNLAAKLGKIFGIEIQDDVDVENLEIRREKLEKLRQITADDEILDNADSVAFSQEELGDLLDNGAEVIYLCGEKFRIPLSVKNVRYVGVNNPTVTISGKGEFDLEASGIVFENCEFSDDTKARFAVKEENVDIVEHDDIVEYEDVVINKDPLHLKNEDTASYMVNFFVDKYLNNPTPFTTKQMNENYFGTKPLRDGDRIILTSEYINFTLPRYNNQYLASVVPAQSKHAAEAIEKHNHVLCYTDDNKEALSSGCLFYIGGSKRYIISSKVDCYGYLQIFIKPEKYTEFLEKFAVTSLIAVPCRKNVNIDILDCVFSEYISALDYTIPLIYIDMSKVVDDMCKKLRKTVRTLDKAGYIFDLGDYGIDNSKPTKWYSNISDSEYSKNHVLSTEDLIKKVEEKYVPKNIY